ncbi:hypothetical protein ACVIHH_002999 [Bradyrhizobium sp. USDA 4518]
MNSPARSNEVQATVEKAWPLPFLLTLTARAEHLLHCRTDQDKTGKRPQAFKALVAFPSAAREMKKRGAPTYVN